MFLVGWVLKEIEFKPISLTSQSYYTLDDKSVILSLILYFYFESKSFSSNNNIQFHISEQEILPLVEGKICEYNVDYMPCDSGFDILCKLVCARVYGRYPVGYICQVGKPGMPNKHFCVCRYQCWYFFHDRFYFGRAFSLTKIDFSWNKIK